MGSWCQQQGPLKPITGTSEQGQQQNSKTPSAGRPTLETTGEASTKIAACRPHSAESDCFVDYTDKVCLFLFKTGVEGLPKYQS